MHDLPVPAPAPCLDTATRLTCQVDRALPQQRQLKPGELGEQYRGPPGKVSPTLLAISSLITVCSMRASAVCEHQNVTKPLHAGNLGVFCHFHGLNRLVVSKRSTVTARKGSMVKSWEWDRTEQERGSHYRQQQHTREAQQPEKAF